MLTRQEITLIRPRLEPWIEFHSNNHNLDTNLLSQYDYIRNIFVYYC
jgi:hypothetical protein